MTKLLDRRVDVIRQSNFFHFFLFTNCDRKFGDQRANEKHQFDGFEYTKISTCMILTARFQNNGPGSASQSTLQLNEYSRRMNKILINTNYHLFCHEIEKSFFQTNIILSFPVKNNFLISLYFSRIFCNIKNEKKSLKKQSFLVTEKNFRNYFFSEYSKYVLRYQPKKSQKGNWEVRKKS